MAVTIDGTKGVTSSGSFYGQTTFTGTYTDGVVVDYTTGMGRISVGASDGLTIYNGGVASSALVTVDSSGNVGIGIASPSALLDVYKAAQGGNSTFRAYGPAGQILWANGGASTSYLDSDTTIFRQSSASGNAERMRITANGGVAFGGAANYGSSGQYLKSNGDAAPTWASIQGTPAGMVAFFAMSTAPTGFLKANGAAVSRTTYATLFAAIGTTFGAGDGSTTFNVPDMRGYFARGWADNGSVDSGRTFGSTQTDQFQGHYHAMNTFTGGGGGAGYGASYYGNGVSPVAMAAANGPTTPTTGANGTVRYGNETRPVNVALLACISY